jgi:hypothetical protein
MKPYGGNYRILDKYVSLYGIDTSHFLGQGWNVNNSPSDIKPIEKYLNNEIPITSYKLKKRLLKAIDIYTSILPENEKLFELIELVNCATNSTDISLIVEKGLDYTEQLRD